MQQKLYLSLLVVASLLAVQATFVTRTDALNSQLEPFWLQGARVSPLEKHTVHFAIKPKADAHQSCNSLAERVSDPDSEFYTQYLELEDLKGLFTDVENTKIVERWLAKNGLKYTTSANGDFISVTAPIGKLERVFHTKYYTYQSLVETGKSVRRSVSYSLPAEIDNVVDFVSHTVNFPPIKTQILTTQDPSPQQSGTVTPQTIFSTYKISTPTTTNPNANQSLFEALGQDFSPADLTAFQQQFNVAQNAVENVIGPNDPTQCSSNPNNCGEANLDVQYIMAVAQNAPTLYWSIDPNSNDPFVDWAIALGTTPHPPLVHSMSYGSVAQEDSSHDVLRFNLEMCKATLRGLTVVIATGDDGVANFVARNNQSNCGFHPSFPATSPYVVAVGATQGPESGQPEIACTSATGGIITSGGGFSYFFPRPSYQSSVVAAYLQNGPSLPPLSMFNSTGRAYPDVAVLGFNFNVVIGGSTYTESGTSASAPTFAGMVTLVNNARLNAGKAPLGWLNPALYKLGESSGIFNDITSGENNCAAGQSPNIVCCQYGFTATTGWDPVTGLGSINFPNFLAALSAL